MGAALQKREVCQSREPCVLASLADRGGRQIDGGDGSYVRSQQQLRITDAAPQAQHLRFPARPRGSEDSPHHVPAKLLYGGLGEVLLREARVECFVMCQLSG